MNVIRRNNVHTEGVDGPPMLFAHGFLRRVFEIFERHQTSVDVVATSEVSVSVTVDDPARPPLHSPDHPSPA